MFPKFAQKSEPEPWNFRFGLEEFQPLKLPPSIWNQVTHPSGKVSPFPEPQTVRFKIWNPNFEIRIGRALKLKHLTSKSRLPIPESKVPNRLRKGSIPKFSVPFPERRLAFQSNLLPEIRAEFRFLSF